MGYPVVAPPFLGQIFISRDTGEGWSENYWPNGATYDDAMTSLTAISTARLVVLSSEFTVLALRVSSASIKRDTIVFTQGDGTGAGSFSTGGGTRFMPSEVALNCRVGYDTTDWAMRQFRGLPVGLPNNFGRVDFTYTTFMTPFNAFLTVYQTNSMLVTKNPAPPPAYRANPINTIQISSLFSRRKCGRPFGQSRGRRLVG